MYQVGDKLKVVVPHGSLSITYSKYCLAHGLYYPADQDCPTCTQPDTIPHMPKKEVDEKEEQLRAKLLPKFNGEARCRPPKPPSNCPVLPYFVNDAARNAESFRAIKRFISTNLKDWPVCRWSRQPMELRIEGKTMKDDPYGGEKAEPRFYCPDCGTWS